MGTVAYALTVVTQGRKRPLLLFTAHIPLLPPARISGAPCPLNALGHAVPGPLIVTVP